jgi:hypothetical protein
MKKPRMHDDQRRTVTRRAALALLPWLCLAVASPGCWPAGDASRGAAGIPDRLKKMQARRGTGDPRRHAKQSPFRIRQRSRPRRFSVSRTCRIFDIPALS